MKWTYKFDEFLMPPYYFDINVGDAVLVLSKENLLTGDTSWQLHKDCAETGYPGLLDSDYRCFHGWRGTYNNDRYEAHGVYKVKSVEHIRKPNKYYIADFILKIVLDKHDIKKDEE